MTYTVQSWIEHWMEEYQSGNRPSTYQAKVYIIKNHISPNLGCIPLKQLTKKKINEFMEDRRLHGNHRKNSDSYPCLGTEALNNIFRVLYQSLEQAVKDGILESNPAKGFHYRKTKKLKMDPMTKAEAERYLEAAETLGYLAMFELELTSGLSQGELIALKWSDLDTESRLLTVHEGRTYSCRRLIDYEDDVRVIPLPLRTVTLLCKEHALHPSSPYMFTHKGTLNPFSPNMVRRFHNEILEYAGLNHIRFEDLRHTFAVLALERGMPVKELSQIMGYARITVARQLYQEYFPVNPVEPQSGVPKDRKIIRATNTLCFTVKKKK